MVKQVVLDLFCGAGGAADGYAQAGYDVIGVDINPQPNYPYEFVQGDALVGGSRLLQSFQFAFVHASPPCQRYSDLQKRSGLSYPDYISATRNLLAPFPYVIENVDTAPLIDPIMLCGAMFPPLRVYRHRKFETNLDIRAPEHPKHVKKVFTHDKRKAHYGQWSPDMFIQVTGGGNAPHEEKLKAMGINRYLNRREINEAIPPAYTRYIGEQIYDQSR